MKNVMPWLKGIIGSCYRPRPKNKAWQWCETLRIPATESAEFAGQFWSSAKTPYVRRFMELATSPGKLEIFISKSSQVGFTMACLLIICWFIKHSPRGVGYCIDNIEEARRISKSRLRRWILDNKLLDEIGDSQGEMNTMTYYLRGMIVYIFGAESEGAWLNKALGIVILDELDAHDVIPEQGNTVELARDRLKVDRNSKLIGFSTPKLEDGQTWQNYLRGTQEKFNISCPHCSHKQDFKWDNIIFGTKEFRDLAGAYLMDKIRAETYYKCELCHKKINHEEKAALMEKGEWIITNLKAIPGVFSFHISDLYSPFVTWGELACQFIEAQGRPTKLLRFFNGRLGLPYVEKHGEVSTDDLRLLCANYPRGTCPVRVCTLTITIDRQQGCEKIVICGWTANGDCYLVDFREVSDLDEAYSEIFTIRDCGGEEWTVQTGFVDEGYKAQETRRWALSTDDMIYPCKGRGGNQVRATVRAEPTWVQGQERILVYHVDDAGYKSLLRSKFKQNKSKRVGKLYFPQASDMPDEFFDELLSERPVKKANKSGYVTTVWEKNPDIPNDYFDCLKYQYALWDVIGPSFQEEKKSA